MIQILLDKNEKYSMTEMAKIAVEAGCGWLILPDTDIEKFRTDIPDIVDLCREAGVILTVRNDIDSAREFGLHGIMLDLGNNPIAARGDLGAEAIIGCVIADSSAASALSMADIDYFILEPSQADIIEKARNAAVENHFVALCKGADIDNDTIDTIRAAGFSGICADSSIFNDENPEERIARLTKTI